MTTSRSKRITERNAKLSTWYERSLAPIVNKGDAADKAIGEKLLNELKETRSVISIFRSYDRRQLFVDTFLKDEAERREHNGEPQLRAYRIPALKAIAELHRRVSLLHTLEVVEERDEDFAGQKKELQKKVPLFNTAVSEIKTALQTAKAARTEVKLDEKNSDIHLRFATEDAEIRARLQESKTQFSQSMAKLTDEALLQKAIADRKDSLTRELARLKSYIDENSFLPTVLDKFTDLVAPELKIIQQHETEIDLGLKSIANESKLIPSIISESDLASSFPLGKPDPYPYTEFKAAINGQRNNLHLVWWEPDWDSLRQFAKATYAEWDQLLEKKDFKDRLKKIENCSAEYDNIKRDFDANTSKLQQFRLMLTKDRESFCDSVNTQIRAAFRHYKNKKEWEKLVAQCSTELQNLAQHDAKHIAAVNSETQQLPATQPVVKKQALSLGEAKQALNVEVRNFHEAKRHDFKSYRQLQTAFNDAQQLYQEKCQPLEQKTASPGTTTTQNAENEVKGERDLSVIMLENALKEGEACINQNKSAIQNTLYAAIFEIMKEAFSNHNVLNLWHEQVNYSRFTVLCGNIPIQVPNGTKHLRDSLDKIKTANATNLKTLTTFTNNHLDAAGCFTFFIRSKKTSQIYSLISQFGSIIDNIVRFQKPNEIINQIDGLTKRLRGQGLRINENTINQAAGMNTPAPIPLMRRALASE